VLLKNTRDRARKTDGRPCGRHSFAIREYPLKFRNLLPVALLTVLCGCGEPSPDEALNATLPHVSLSELLPPAEANEHCNSALDSDLLYGIGYQLYNDGQPEQARSCLIMAAPTHDRALCYLASIAEQDTSKDSAQRDREAFGYMAYSAQKNDSCAEFGMFQNFTYGMRGQTADTALGLRWLERSARHGDPDSQQTLMRFHSGKDELALAYGWARILDDTAGIAELKQRMNPQQISDGEKAYEQLSKDVTSKERVRQDAREENLAVYAANIHLQSPETFSGLSPAQRHDVMAQALATVSARPEFGTRAQLYAYVIISRQVQLKGGDSDVLHNPQLLALLSDKELQVAEAVDKARGILDQPQL
jgi:TPR repeat protein